MIQETFSCLFEDDAKALRSWDPERGASFDNFIGVITEHQVCSILRSGRRSPLKEDPTSDDEMPELENEQSSPEELVANRELAQAILDRYRAESSILGIDMLNRIFCEDRAVEEICAETKQKPANIHTWKKRILNRLRRIGEELLSDKKGDDGDES